MINAPNEADQEVFDPTGQGVEVVSADFARRVVRERDEALKLCHAFRIALVERDLTLSLPAEVQIQTGETPTENFPDRSRKIHEANIRLREIFPKILKALGHESVCVSSAAVEFLENIPDIVREELHKARTGRASRNKDGEVFAQTLLQISDEVGEFGGHPDCTTLDSVRLMKCRVQELEARDARRKIHDSWRQPSLRERQGVGGNFIPGV